MRFRAALGAFLSGALAFLPPAAEASRVARPAAPAPAVSAVVARLEPLLASPLGDPAPLLLELSRLHGSASPAEREAARLVVRSALQAVLWRDEAPVRELLPSKEPVALRRVRALSARLQPLLLGTPGALAAFQRLHAAAADPVPAPDRRPLEALERLARGVPFDGAGRSALEAGVELEDDLDGAFALKTRRGPAVLKFTETPWEGAVQRAARAALRDGGLEQVSVPAVWAELEPEDPLRAALPLEVRRVWEHYRAKGELRAVLLMDRAPGRDLELLSDLEPEAEPSPEAVEELTEAVEVLHAEGIAHGDLAERNLVLGPEGELQLVDWGMGSAADEAELIDKDRRDVRELEARFLGRRLYGASPLLLAAWPAALPTLEPEFHGMLAVFLGLTLHAFSRFVRAIPEALRGLRDGKAPDERTTLDRLFLLARWLAAGGLLVALAHPANLAAALVVYVGGGLLARRWLRSR